MRLALVGLALLFVGCSAPPDDAPRNVLLHASFGPGYTQADVDEVCRILACQGVETSDPPRIAGWFRTQDECERARARVLAVPHATTEPCGKALSSAWWSLHGSFLQGYTQEDVKAVCQAATARDTCAVMESEPPQFGFAFPTLDVCQKAHDDIRAVPHVVVSACAEGGEKVP